MDADEAIALAKRVETLEFAVYGGAYDQMRRRIEELEAENAKLKLAMKKMCDSAYAIKQATINEANDPFG